MKGKGLGGLLVAVVLTMASALSCSRGPEVIPKRQMEKIYHDMFLADQWIADNMDKKPKADTMWFYEPIFGKYGYTVEDYRASVEYYLADPKRYAEMMGRIVKVYEEEAAAINREIAQKEKIRHRADSIANAMRAFRPDDLKNYSDLFYVDQMTDRIEIRQNSRGVYYPVPVVEDTMFHGPELIIRDTTSAVVSAPVKEIKPIPWRD